MTELEKAARMALDAVVVLSHQSRGHDRLVSETLDALTQALATTEPAPKHDEDDGDITGRSGPLPETGWDEVPEGAFHKPSPTAGMNLGERIKHVGGRENAAGYIEFGSVAAVRALVRQYLRDLPAPQPATTEPEWETSPMDGEQWETTPMSATTEPGELTRSQKLRNAGYTRRPSWKTLPSDADDADDAPETNCGNATERKGEPFGQVTVKHPVGPFHAPLYTFYPWPQPPYLDNVQECHTVYTSPQVPEDVQRDAERYRFLAEKCRRTSEHWGGRWSIVIEGPAPKSHDSEDDLDEAIDTARKGE